MSRIPVFESPFAGMMEQFVAHKQMRGFDYTASANTLGFFDRFLCGMDCSEGVLHGDCFTRYLATLQHLEPISRKARLGVVHQFSRYLNAYRPESRVMPLRLLPPVPQATRFCPISPAEVCGLMHAAGKLQPKGGIRGACIRFLIGLLYTTGLRISEAAGLNLGDVDLERGTLFIHRGKFGKDRLVALSPSTRSALDAWMRQRAFHAGNARSDPLLVGAPNKRLTLPQAQHAFRKLCETCGLKGEKPPRLHDLRHNYATECLARWRREGKNIQALLPVLSAAMGHVNPESTQCYIHISASTLLDASEKIQKHFNPTPEETP